MPANRLVTPKEDSLIGHMSRGLYGEYHDLTRRQVVGKVSTGDITEIYVKIKKKANKAGFQWKRVCIDTKDILRWMHHKGYINLYDKDRNNPYVKRYINKRGRPLGFLDVIKFIPPKTQEKLRDSVCKCIIKGLEEMKTGDIGEWSNIKRTLRLVKEAAGEENSTSIK